MNPIAPTLAPVEGEPRPAREALRLNARLYSGPLIVMAGNASYLVFAFLINIVLVNALAPAEYGLLALGVAVLTIAQEVCGGVDVAVLRFATTHDREHEDRIFAAGLQIKLAVNAVLCTALWLMAGPLAGLFQEPAARLVVQTAAVSVLVGSVYSIGLTRLQMHQAFGRFALLRGLSNFLRFACLAVLWRTAGLTLETALWVGVATLAVSSIVAASFDRPPFAAWAVVDRAALRQLVAFGGFVAISKLLFTVYNRLDLFFLAHWRSAGEVAIYSAATTLTYAIDLTTFSIITARMANIGRLNDSAELRRHVRATLRLCMTFAIVILPLWLFARPVIDTLYTSRYHESAAVFRVLFLGSWMTMLVHPLYLVLYARQRTRALLWADAVLIAVSCAMGPLLVPAWGVIGAATMTVAARAAGCVVILLLVGRELGWLRMAPASARS